MQKLNALVGILLLVLAGCGSGTTTASKPGLNLDGYPLDVCMVSGEKLGAMGEPYIIKHDGKTVKFCCSACLKEFNKDTAKYMGILQDAQKKQDAAK